MSNTEARTRDHETAGVLVRPPFLFLGAILGGLGLHALLPVGLPPGVVGIRVGLPFVAAAFSLFLWAVLTFRRAATPVPTDRPTTTIVTRGPYRFSRNPIYLAMTFLVIGVALWTGRAWILATLLLAHLVLYAGVIRREERYLDRRFGEVYAAYRRRVRRWI